MGLQALIFISLIFSLIFAQTALSIDSIVTSSELFSASDDSHNLYASMGWHRCTSDEHMEPESTQEVSEILRQLNSADRPFKVRPTRRGYHSSNGFACPGTTTDTKLPTGQNQGPRNGEPGTQSVTLLMHRMNRVLAVDHVHHRLTVEAGMTLQNLADAVVQNGMSVPVGVLCVYGNLTVSGVLAASAHGTGLGVDSSLGDIVIGIKWVNGKGDIITSDVTDEKGLSEIRGLLGGVGLLGILSEVTFQLLPAGALAQVEVWTKDDSTIAADVKDQLQSQSPHILYYWRPDLSYYRARIYKPLQAGSVPVHPYYPSGMGAIMEPVPESSGKLMWETMKSFQADIDESSPDAHSLNGMVCMISHLMMNAGTFTDGEGNDVDNATIPTSHAMIGQECEPSCIWTPKAVGSTGEDNEFTIRLSDLEEWVKDVKAIVKGEEAERQNELDRRYGKGKVQACMPPGYFWLRFGKPTENLLATTAGMDEPVVYAMMTFITSVLVSNAPPKQDHILQIIEQLSLCKYGARPHYGKNYYRTFTNEDCPVMGNYPKQSLLEMRKLQEQHDPRKVFESELLTRMLEKKGPIYEDKCCLTHKCYCKEDSHCADGFKCQPSVVFPEYKACKVHFSQKETIAKDEL